MKLKLSEEESVELVTKARAAAVALAEYWDVLHSIEESHSVTCETGTCDVISVMAGECDVPPNPHDLAAWDAETILGDIEVTE